MSVITDLIDENSSCHARIAELEGETAKRDETIARLEPQLNRAIQANYDLREELARVTQADAHYQAEALRLAAELAAIKAQEPVARLPACPSRAFAVANLRDLAQSVLQHDPDVGMFRDEDQAFLINELADLAESFNGDVKLYAAPVSEAKAQVYEPLVCDYCNAETQDPWHGSGMLNGVESRHIHACSQCRNLLPTAKVQGVVMPDVNAAAKALCNRHAMICGVDADDQWKEYSQDFIADAETVLANAAPAAPAADASGVLDQAMYTLISIGYHENSGLVHELRQALAAHRAKWVV